MTAINLPPAAAKRELTALRRKRVTKTSRDVCVRCGGAGGHSRWPGFTCFRCGGVNSRTHELLTTRVYTDSADAEYDAFLQGIIDAAEEAAFKAKAAVRLAEQRELDHEAALAEDANRAARAATPYLGEVGGKVTACGSVLFAQPFESQFGSSMLIIMRDAATGAIVKTFSSSASAWGVERGMLLELTATVKAHEVYRGEKNTVVTRAKMSASYPQDEAAS
jgi:hypothetical protein